MAFVRPVSLMLHKFFLVSFVLSAAPRASVLPAALLGQVLMVVGAGRGPLVRAALEVGELVHSK